MLYCGLKFVTFANCLTLVSNKKITLSGAYIFNCISDTQSTCGAPKALHSLRLAYHFSQVFQYDPCICGEVSLKAHLMVLPI